MTGGEGLREVGAAELMHIREAAWRRRLASVSLVAEYVAPPEHTEQTLSVLGRMYRRSPFVADRLRLLRRWPAVQVLSTTGVATEHYAGGTFWPKLTSLAGLPNEQVLHREWGEAYLANLQTLGLTTFEDSEDAGARFVGRILMHSGVPTYCLGDYFRLVAERRRRIAGLEPDAFVSWAVERACEGHLANVDKPVTRFLRFGGEFAVDVSDRVFELLDLVAAGGDGSGVPLPERFRLTALEMRDRGQIDTPRAKAGLTANSAGGPEHPHIVLDPYGRGLVLRLPAVSEAPDGLATWVVTVDARTERVRTQALWPGAHEPAPQTDVSIPTPARSATVALEGHEQHVASVAIVDDKDPLLAFSEDGRLLPASLPLRGTPTWLLFPGRLEDVRTQGDLRIMAEGALPPGWSGWTLFLADLATVSSVGLAGAARSHQVRRFSSARISVDEPVLGTRSQSGAPLFATAPRIDFPEALGAAAAWDVSVSGGDGRVLARREFNGIDDPNVIWDELPRPLFGTYIVRIRGPWGRGATRQIAVAEGLAVRSSPPWRRLTGKGLTPASLTIDARSGLTPSWTRVELAEDQTEIALHLAVRGTELAASVSPPHMTLSYQAPDRILGPTVKSISLYSEDLVESPGTLTVDVGADGDPQLHVLVGGRPIQCLEPGASSRTGVFQFDLSRMVDTLRAHPQVRLCLDDIGRLTVAAIRPRKLFTDVQRVGCELQFMDCVEIDGLTAIIYPSRAPWLGGQPVEVSAGVVEIPDLLRDAGPLLVTLRIEDPWAPEPLPVWPGSGTAVLVDAEGFVESDDPHERALSAFLAGEGDFPPGVDKAHLWTVLAWFGGLALGDRFEFVRDTLTRALAEDPAASLRALSVSRAQADRLPATLIRSGLAWAPLTTSPAADGDDPEWSRRTAVQAALLWAATPHRDVAQLIEDASDICGDDISSLADGCDPHPGAGRFDASADLYARLDPAGRARFRSAAAFVPHGLLDADTRVHASLELLERRKDPVLGWLGPNAHRVLAETQRLLTVIDGRQGLAAVKSRLHPSSDGGWRVLPAISIGLAFASRYAARGNEVAAGWLPRQRRAWTDLARVAPDLVSIDLIVAALMIPTAPSEKPEEGL